MVRAEADDKLKAHTLHVIELSSLNNRIQTTSKKAAAENVVDIYSRCV